LRVHVAGDRHVGVEERVADEDCRVDAPSERVDVEQDAGGAVVLGLLDARA